jgi:hypothetical protein
MIHSGVETMLEAFLLLAITAAVLIAIYSERFRLLLVAIITGALSQQLGGVLASQSVKDHLNELVILAWEKTVTVACDLCVLAECTNCEMLCSLQIWTFPF